MQQEKLHFKYAKLITDGFVTKNGVPLKCFRCNGKNLKLANKLYNKSKVLMSFDSVCEQCNKTLGHWENGVWHINL